MVHIYLQLIGSFSAVSVPSRWAKRGIGKLLVESAEIFLRQKAHDLISLNNTGSESSSLSRDVCLRMEMSVVSVRTDLFPWYESQGYAIVETLVPNPPDFQMLLSEEYSGKVSLVIMRKQLLI